MELLFLVFLDHTQRRSTVGRNEIFRKYSLKTLVVLEGVIPLETTLLVEWH